MSARNTWVYLGAVSWLAAVWLGLLGGCGSGVAGGDTAAGSAGTTAPATATTATTLAQAQAGGATTTTMVVGASGPSTTLGLRPTALNDLSAEIRGLLGESGVPVYLPLVLPRGYDVAAMPAEDPDGKGNPTAWQLAEAGPGPRTAGYAVLFTDGAHRIRLDINPAGDLGDIQWADAGLAGAYGPLHTTTASGTTWVAVENPDGVEILVSGDTGVSEALLFLASKVARVEGG